MKPIIVNNAKAEIASLQGIATLKVGGIGL
jgi:hypothetical protein